MAWDGLGRYTEPLAEFAKLLKPKSILEIGFGYEGFSTSVWLEHTDAQVTSIDKGDWIGNASSIDNPRFKFIKGRSEEVMPTLKQRYDLIYIDGDHRYAGAKKDMENAIRLLKPGGVILLDDYGVEHAGGLDLDDNGAQFEGHYGVKQAADEVFAGDWEHLYKDIDFANGARVYARRSS